MAKNKGSRITITLECSNKDLPIDKERNKGLFRYTTTKNRRNTPGRIELRKYCPHHNCHILFKEIKQKQHLYEHKTEISKDEH